MVNSKKEADCNIVTDVEFLRQQSTPFNSNKVNDEISEMASRLFSFKGDHLGLAAPQINTLKRAFLARLSIGHLVFIDPEITWRGNDSVPSVEKCLSLPDIVRCVSRDYQIKVSASIILQQIPGTTEIIPFSNDKPMLLRSLDAFIVQHEYDHLNGVLITDLTEVPTVEEKRIERQQKRLNRIGVARASKKKQVPVPSKPKTLSKKQKRQRKNERKRIQKRVEIEETIRLQKELSISTERSADIN